MDMPYLNKRDLYFFEKFYQTNNEWWNNKYIDWVQLASLRDNLIDENYWQILIKFISLLEGYMATAYEDGMHYSIGYGLLFKRCDKNEYEKLAIDIFKKALDINLYDFIPIEIFNEPKNKIAIELKKYQLNKEQCQALLYHTLQYNQSLLSARIPQFHKLSCNLQIALHSMWYNSPALIGPNMLRILGEYLASGDQIYLLDCICEIECNSNPTNGEYYLGLQNRRYKEAFMCSNPILDFIIHIPDKYFEKFLTQMNKDMPDVYSVFANHFYLIENNISESVKLASLLGYIPINIFPNMQYLLQTMRKITN